MTITVHKMLSVVYKTKPDTRTITKPIAATPTTGWIEKGSYPCLDDSATAIRLYRSLL